MTVENFKLPVGRIVSGSPVASQIKTDFKTKQPKLSKDGQPIKEWRCDIAIPKQEFIDKVWPTMVQEAMRTLPNAGTMHPDQYEQSGYSFKVVNGDSPACPKNSKIPYNTRDGFPGHYIIKIRTEAFAPGVFKFENGAYRQVAENEIKCGDYVVANVNLKAHSDEGGGLYWNPNGFELVGYGQEIKSSGSANPEELFGRQTYQLPTGASAMPSMGMSQNFPQSTPFAPAAGGMPVLGMGNAAFAGQSPNNGVTNSIGTASGPFMGTNMQPPPPAMDFVQNAGAGFTQPAAPAGGQQPTGFPTGATSAPFAMTFPGR